MPQLKYSYIHRAPFSALDHFKSYLIAAREKAIGAGIEFPVVTIVLDGENPWENYDNNGIDFLHGIYRILEEEPLLTSILPMDRIAHTHVRPWQDCVWEFRA